MSTQTGQGLNGLVLTVFFGVLSHQGLNNLRLRAPVNHCAPGYQDNVVFCSPLFVTNAHQAAVPQHHY